MDFSALKTDIANRFPGVTDPQVVANGMNALIVSVQGDISVSEALTWCAGQGLLIPLQTAATTAGPLQNVCAAAVTMFNGGYPIFALSSASVQALLSALVSGAIITTAQQTAIMALGLSTVAYVQQTYGAPLISADDVLTAWRQ